LFAQEREKYRIVSQKFKQGLATSLDLTEAETDLTAAELQLQQNYIGWLKHMATLNYVTGKIKYH
jgi:outer membrane protein TolC